MFFELNDENRIGFKALTTADMGKNKTSHQTHIGLFDDVLTFLPNSIEIDDSLLVYNNQIDVLPLSFDRIQSQNGIFRSPKIRAGGRDIVSVVSVIREITSSHYTDEVVWYLFWFGLKSEQIVFLLFSNDSDIYEEITLMGLTLTDSTKNRISIENENFNEIVKYLESIVNNSGHQIAASLEIEIQKGTSKTIKNRYRKYDISKAQEIFSKIGLKGEELIDTYLSTLKHKKQICSYCWENKDDESGLPYDFHIEMLDGTIIYLDVKTTNYNFDQKMVFSGSEIKFALDNISNEYHVFRVYQNNESWCLKICRNCIHLFNSIQDCKNIFDSNLDSLAEIMNIKYSISPLQESLTFDAEIVLTSTL